MMPCVRSVRPWPVMVLAGVAILMLAALAGESRAEPGSVVFTWNGRRASLRADKAPVAELLERIGAKTGARIVVLRADPGTVSLEVTNATLESLMERLSGGGYVITYGTGQDGRPGRVEEILILGQVSAGEPAQAPESGPGSPTIVIEPARERPNTYAGIGMKISRMGVPSEIWVSPMGPDTPAGRAGIEEGDRLLAVDGVPVAEIKSMADLAERIRGPEGSTVQLRIRRLDGTEIELAVDRERIEQPREAQDGRTPSPGPASGNDSVR